MYLKKRTVHIVGRFLDTGQLTFFRNKLVVFFKRLQVDVSIETARLEFFDVITAHANDMNNSRSRRQIGSVVGNN